ncbi:MAG: hypothetical protein ACI4E1_13465 [Lachnospira sp.]
MKFKYYIRGLGTGLIIATFVWVIARNTGYTDSNSDEKETSTVPSIIAITDDESEKETESVTKNTDSDESKSETEKVTEKETEKVTEKETEKATEKATEKSTEKATEKSTEKATQAMETVTVVFKGVTTAYKASDILYDAGLISDKNEFVMYMYTSGYDSKMQDGTYTLKKGDSLETIAKTITRSN